MMPRSLRLLRQEVTSRSAASGELAEAVRILLAGSVWAPRRILSMFVEHAYRPRSKIFRQNCNRFTNGEKEVLAMLVAAARTRKIPDPPVIRERAVKAHIAKLFERSEFRIALRSLRIKHSLVHPEITKGAPSAARRVIVDPLF